ncbi:MAG: hypothetical protein ACD_75C01574G0001 [uncultured bacterium]|nr:MAG: hypothetical protein ACD_75C01574G0001 [uncultured bacterium]
MEGGGKALQHAFLGQDRIGRMKLFEVFEIVENLLGDGVDDLVRYLGGGDEGGLYAEGVDIFLVVGGRVIVDRDVGLGVVGGLVQQVVYRGDLDETHLAGAGGRFLDGAVRMADGVEEGVDLFILQQGRGLGGLDALGFQVFFVVEAGGLQGIDGVLAIAGTGIAQVDPLAFQVGDGLNVGIDCGHQGNEFRVDGKYRTEILLGPFLLPFGQTVIGLELPVGLGDAEFEIAGHYGIDVEYRTAGCLNGCPHAVLVFFAVDHVGNGAARRVIDAGDAAGTDGKKGSFCLSLH